MRVPHLPSACLAVRAGPHDRPPPGRPDLPVQPVPGVRPSPPPQAPAELAARPAPAGGSHLDHPGPADAYRDLRALSGLSRRPPYLGASAASGARTPAASTWRPSCPEELMAGIFLGHELLRGDLKPRLLKPG